MWNALEKVEIKQATLIPTLQEVGRTETKGPTDEWVGRNKNHTNSTRRRRQADAAKNGLLIVKNTESGDLFW